MAAKNYAAQVLRSMNKPELFIDPEKEMDAENMSSLKAFLECAVHFSLPDEGRILNSGQKGIKGEEIRLPYPAITLEFLTHYANATVKTLVLAVESCMSEDEDAVITCSIFYKFSGLDNNWMVCPIVFGMPFAWDESRDENGDLYIESKLAFESTFERLSRRLQRLAKAGHYQNETENLDVYEKTCRQFSGNVLAVLELCEALSCTNIDQSVLQKESKSNPKRIRKGKLPLLEIRTLVIDSNRATTKGERAGYTILGERNSPRQHLRRGHFRFLQSRPGGQQKRKTWVRPCVVGKEGGIVKDYDLI